MDGGLEVVGSLLLLLLLLEDIVGVTLVGRCVIVGRCVVVGRCDVDVVVGLRVIVVVGIKLLDGGVVRTTTEENDRAMMMDGGLVVKGFVVEGLVVCIVLSLDGMIPLESMMLSQLGLG